MSEITDFSQFTLGENHENITISSASDYNLVATELLSQAQRSFYFIGQQLDRNVFDKANFATALLHLARYSRNSDIRFLVHDTTDAIRSGHEVLRLAQRMSSYIQVRLIDQEFKDFIQSFAVVDRRGTIVSQNGTRYEAVANFNNPRSANELLVTFDEIWERSLPDPNFRQLHI